MTQISRTRFFTFLATLYIIFAFIWWTILLFRKNDEAREAHIESIRFQMQKENTYMNEEMMRKTPQYLALKNMYDRHRRMIWSEGGVLFLGLLWGIWIIHKAFQKEVSLTNQRRNFLLSVTHELKSPIASIQLIINTFQKRKLEEKQQEQLFSSANKEVERLNELVNNLLLSAKLDAEYQPVLEEINIKTLFDDIIAKMMIRFPKATIQISKNEVPILRGDKQGLISVFTNLVENAIKYSENPATWRDFHYI